MSNSYATHYYSANGQGQTLCNQRSKTACWAPKGNWQATTTDPSKVTCSKCITLLNKDKQDANSTKAITAKEKKIRAIEREIKSEEKMLAFYNSPKANPCMLVGETREQAIARNIAYTESVLKEARAALTSLQS